VFIGVRGMDKEIQCENIIVDKQVINQEIEEEVMELRRREIEREEKIKYMEFEMEVMRDEIKLGPKREETIKK
jgi:hypothetical protein